jgi:hypothetical protein
MQDAVCSKCTDPDARFGWQPIAETDDEKHIIATQYATGFLCDECLMDMLGPVLYEAVREREST